MKANRRSSPIFARSVLYSAKPLSIEDLALPMPASEGMMPVAFQPR